MLDSKRLLHLAAGLALLSAAYAGSARALTLADLDGGASFAAGPMTFADFDVVVSGDLSIDLADYPVQVLADGFRLSGPLSVLLGDNGTLLLSYTVTASDPVVYGVSLFAPGTAIGAGAQAWAAETVLDAVNLPLAALFAYTLDGAGSDVYDQGFFAPVSFVSVAKTLHVESGLFAALPIVEQRFLTIPEPLTATLVTLGLAGLSLWGSRASRPRHGARIATSGRTL